MSPEADSNPQSFGVLEAQGLPFKGLFYIIPVYG